MMDRGADAKRIRKLTEPSRDHMIGKTEMRMAAGLIFAGIVSLYATGAAWSQTPPAKSDAKPAATAAPAAATAPTATPAAAKMPCTNPDALGIGRVVEIDTTGGPGFGFENFKQLDFLREKEVVLTFD